LRYQIPKTILLLAFRLVNAPLSGSSDAKTAASSASIPRPDTSASVASSAVGTAERNKIGLGAHYLLELGELLHADAVAHDICHG
jgi:hypothetical protein